MTRTDEGGGCCRLTGWRRYCPRGPGCRTRGDPIAGAAEATVLTEGALFEQILEFYENGAARVTEARSRIRGVVLVRVERALPVDSPAYDLGRTEDAVKAQWWSHYARLAHQSPAAPSSHHDARRTLPE